MALIFFYFIEHILKRLSPGKGLMKQTLASLDIFIRLYNRNNKQQMSILQKIKSLFSILTVLDITLISILVLSFVAFNILI